MLINPDELANDLDRLEEIEKASLRLVLIVCGGRPRRDRAEATVRDWLAESITLKKGLTGAKPRAFCYWLFDVLNIRAEDTLDDLYPGTGIVSQALQEYLNTSTIIRKPGTLFAEGRVFSINS